MDPFLGMAAIVLLLYRSSLSINIYIYIHMPTVIYTYILYTCVRRVWEIDSALTQSCTFICPLDFDRILLWSNRAKQDGSCVEAKNGRELWVRDQKKIPWGSKNTYLRHPKKYSPGIPCFLWPLQKLGDKTTKASISVVLHRFGSGASRP